MGIQVTEEEMRMIREGKLDPSKIEEHRKANPIKEHSVDLNELEKIKQEIRETNVLYKNAIQKNKDLYDELAENRKRKEEFRNKIAELRKKKKEIMGVE
ncbi:TPA: hypothetical protein HA265_05360 [Candidatus Woesearchaeota archaeon]|nr:hypothetical protein [Candidatus Woesearchaeota archaeon]